MSEQTYTKTSASRNGLELLLAAGKFYIIFRQYTIQYFTYNCNNLASIVILIIQFDLVLD